MNEAMSFLAKAKSVRDKLERIYIVAMDFSIVDAYKEEIQKEFERIRYCNRKATIEVLLGCQ